MNRTLLDLSLTLGGRALERTFDEADRLALIDFDELGRICAAAAGNPGTARLRKLAERRRLPHSETRSPLESRFLRFCRDRGLPIPAVNVPVAGYEVDCLWRDARLVVELDSWAHHGDRDSFEADRRRDAAVQRAGYRAVRVTDRALTCDPDDLERELRGLLGDARHR